VLECEPNASAAEKFTPPSVPFLWRNARAQTQGLADLPEMLAADRKGMHAVTYEQAEKIWRAGLVVQSWDDDHFLRQCGIAPLGRNFDNARLPPVPDGYRRILASDNRVWDIPEDRINQAFQIDQNLHVLTS
jgi:hypothetical protein